MCPPPPTHPRRWRYILFVMESIPWKTLTHFSFCYSWLNITRWNKRFVRKVSTILIGQSSFQNPVWARLYSWKHSRRTGQNKVRVGDARFVQARQRSADTTIPQRRQLCERDHPHVRLSPSPSGSHPPSPWTRPPRQPDHLRPLLLQPAGGALISGTFSGRTRIRGKKGTLKKTRLGK